MKKRGLSVIISAVMVVVTLAGCGLTGESTAIISTDAGTPAALAASSEAITLIYAEADSPDSVMGQMAVKFKEEVESRSDGTIIIDIQASGVLGSEKEVLEGMLEKTGRADISRISASALADCGGEMSRLLSLPYTFVSRDHFWNFADSEFVTEFLDEPHKNGQPVIGLFYGEEGFRHFFTRERVSNKYGFVGMKLRVSNDPVMVDVVNAFGAEAATVSFGDLYSALRDGTCDGAERPIADYRSNGFAEVAPNMILDGHTLDIVEVVVAEDAWKDLTAGQQDILREAGRAAAAYDRQITESGEKEALEELKAGGVNIVEVRDRETWQEAIKKVTAAYIGDQEELYQQLQEFR